MSKFTDMIKSDVEKVFLNTNDFAESAVYSYGNYNTKCNVILNHNIELIGEYGAVGEKITTIKLSSDVEVNIGGSFHVGSSYFVVDNLISNDGAVQMISVVEQ